MSDPAIAGYGVIDGPPLPLSPNNTVIANLSGATAYPTAVTLAALSAALSTVAYQGTWNASTNTPTLVSSVGTGGQYYIVSVAGTTSLNGISDWSVGDWAIFNSTTSAWQKIEAGVTALSVGSTVISGGVTTRILYDNAGVLGEYTISGTGTVVAMQAGPSFTGTAFSQGTMVFGGSVATNAVMQIDTNVAKIWSSGTLGWTPAADLTAAIDVNINRGGAGVLRIGTTAANALGALQVATAALGGATIGTDALTWTGTATGSGQLNIPAISNGASPLNFAGASVFGQGLQFGGKGRMYAVSSNTFFITDDTGSFGIALKTSSATFDLGIGLSADVLLRRQGAANLGLGAAAVDTAPVAQTLSVQNTLAGGTSNVAGANFTIAGSQGKGTGVGGSLIFQVAPAGSTGTVVNALATVLTLDSTKLATFAGKVAVGTSADPFSRSYGNSIGITSSSTAALAIDAATGSAAAIDLGVNGTRTGALSSDATSVNYFTAGTSIVLKLGVNFNNDLTITNGGNVSVRGTLTGAAAVADSGYNYQTPSTGFTITMANSNYHLILDPAGTLATGTITMCAAPVDGQCVDIKISQIITALTVAGNSGQSVKGNPTSAAVGSSFTGVYRATNTTWYF